MWFKAKIDIIILSVMGDISSLVSNFPFGGILLGLVFLVYWVQTFLIVYHLTRFGIGPVPKIFALIFFIGSGVLFMLAVGLYGRVHLGDLGNLFRGSVKDLLPDTRY